VSNIACIGSEIKYIIKIIICVCDMQNVHFICIIIMDYNLICLVLSTPEKHNMYLIGIFIIIWICLLLNFFNVINQFEVSLSLSIHFFQFILYRRRAVSLYYYY